MKEASQGGNDDYNDDGDGCGVCLQIREEFERERERGWLMSLVENGLERDMRGLRN